MTTALLDHTTQAVQHLQAARDSLQAALGDADAVQALVILRAMSATGEAWQQTQAIAQALLSQDSPAPA